MKTPLYARSLRSAGLILAALALAACGGSGGDEAGASGPGGSTASGASGGPGGSSGGSGGSVPNPVGAVSGLAGSGLVLLVNGEELPIGEDGGFAFPATLPPGTAYTVTIKTPPTTPYQDCTIANASGVTGAAGAGNITVVCHTNTNTTHTVGGTLIWPEDGGSVLLQVNGLAPLSVTASGASATPFTFSTGIPGGSAYVVTVQSSASANQVSHTCALSNARGVMGGANVSNVTVDCSSGVDPGSGGTAPDPDPDPGSDPDPVAFAQIRVTVTGLAGSGLLLDTGDDRTLPLANGVTNLDSSLVAGDAYQLAVVAQPTNPSQTCALVGNTGGTVPPSGVIAVAINCTTETFALGVNVTGLNEALAATGTNNTQMRIQNLGGDDLVISSDGYFPSSNRMPSGSSYALTILSQPGDDTSGGIGLQFNILCFLTVPNDAPVITNADATFEINCVAPIGFAYATNSRDNTLSSFVIGSDGSLTATGVAPTGNSPASVVAVADELVIPGTGGSYPAWAYVANAADSTIGAYTLDAEYGSAGVAAVTYPLSSAATGQNSLLLTPQFTQPTGASASMLYVTNGGSGSVSGMSRFPGTGVLGFTSPAQPSLVNVPQPFAIDYTYDIDLLALYVLHQSNTLEVFRADLDATAPTGPFESIASVNTAASPTALVAAAANDPAQTNIYVATSSDNTIRTYLASFTPEAGGVGVVPSDLPDTVVTLPAGDGPISLLRVSEETLLAVNSAGVWVIDRLFDSGQIFLNPLNQTAPSVGVGAGPYSMSVISAQRDDESSYLYITNSGDGTVSGFELDRDASIGGFVVDLAPLPGSPYPVGVGVSSIATTPRPALAGGL